MCCQYTQCTLDQPSSLFVDAASCTNPRLSLVVSFHLRPQQLADSVPWYHWRSLKKLKAAELPKNNSNYTWYHLKSETRNLFFQVALCLKQSGRFSLRNMLPFAAKIGGPHFKTWPFEPWISPFSGILELEAARIRTLHGAICNFLDLGSLQKVRSILEPAFVQY